ncbi:MAG: hypothetical protein Q7S80_02475 [bacterium]|nr:hypothetical protein [bacterium]
MQQKPDDQTRQPGGIELLNLTLLKTIFEKCTRIDYPDKYGTAMFGENVELTAEELAELDSLVTKARALWEGFVTQKPLFKKFDVVLEQRRAKVGSMMEDSSILSDPQATDVIKEFRDGPSGKVPAIRVPAEIASLNHWRNEINTLAEDVRLYRAGYLTGGMRADVFGKRVKEVYRFLKEATKA